MKKKNIKRILVIVSSVAVGIVLICGAILLTYSIQCGDISGEERIAMRICEDSDEDLSTIVYANFLKKNHNGYRYYYYYDVFTGDGSYYIVELRDNGSNMEFTSKYSYSGPINRFVILNRAIKYRSSDVGQFSDSLDDALDQLHSHQHIGINIDMLIDGKV